MDIHRVAETVAHNKAKLIDAHLLRFLTEQGINVAAWEAGKIKEELREKELELLLEVERYEGSEVYTFKLCKLLSKTGLHIPTPTITIT